VGRGATRALQKQTVVKSEGGAEGKAPAKGAWGVAPHSSFPLSTVGAGSCPRCGGQGGEVPPPQAAQKEYLNAL
jgi:hypothetical protein